MKEKAKPAPVAYAWYIKKGESGRIEAYVRPSQHKDGWYTFENTLNENEHGPKAKMVTRYINFDRAMKRKGYEQTQNFTGDPDFNL